MQKTNQELAALVKQLNDCCSAIQGQIAAAEAVPVAEKEPEMDVEEDDAEEEERAKEEFVREIEKRKLQGADVSDKSLADIMWACKIKRRKQG